MNYRVGVEDIEGNHWVAWVFDLMGCYATGKTQEEVIARVPAHIAAYFTWLEKHGDPIDHSGDEIGIDVVESFISYEVENGYLVNAFFTDDKVQITHAEIQNARRILTFTRNELMTFVASCSQDEFHGADKRAVGGSIARTIKHIAWAEWWYLDRLDLSFERQQMPDDPLEMIKHVRVHLLNQLPVFIGNDRIVELNHERWSPRKVLRRTIWHERDHTQQIRTLLRD